MKASFPPPKVPPLEEGLLRAMRALDNQIAREMQRSPAERDEHGVQKWKPFETRVENVTALLLNKLGDNEVQLDSLLILNQAFARALRLFVEDLGKEGLGSLRGDYCTRTFEVIAEEARRGSEQLRTGELM